MDKIHIIGGTPLRGSVAISGAKNAALPLMAASLLTSKTITLSNVPHLSDITTMANLLVSLGATLELNGDSGSSGREISLNAADVTETTAPYDIVRKMRASVVVLGPLLARFGKARVSLPGGCAIGTRPVDLHISALEQMGATIELEDGYINALTQNGLHGAEITFPKISVGATENILMAATVADGKTIINNAASEPEVTDLANCLCKMGADIRGIGTDTLMIEGVGSLNGTEYQVMPDRIEAGSYAVAAVITGGELELTGITNDIMQATTRALETIGATVVTNENSIHVSRSADIHPMDFATAPYPNLATDMQAQLMALLCLAKGTSHITETIFENRFMHVPELQRMGAEIAVEGNMATVTGVESLKGAQVMASDLRASISLVLAALAAEGESTVNRVYHIDRGYERVEEKLAACGAQIERLKD